MRYFVIVLVFFLTGCSSSPKFIEEPQLERIITEAMITSALVERDNLNYDTLDVYAAILAKEDVTMADVKYTIAEMAGRKSSPLNHLFEQINSNVDSLNAQAAYRFMKKLRFDTLATNFVRDTLYYNDTTVVGNPAKFKAMILDIKGGDIVVQFDYLSNKTYDIGVPMLKAYVSKGKIRNDRSAWVNRTNTEIKFRQVITVPSTGYDTLSIGFTAPSLKKGVKLVDSSYIKNITILYNPPIVSARRRYFEHITNIKTDLNYGHQKDSLFSRFAQWPDSTKFRFDLSKWPLDVDSTKRKRD